MSLPAEMDAVEIAEPGGPDVLRLVRRPVPEPRAGEVLIRVAWAGVNRPDALQRAGAYDPPPDASDLPGLECSGEIVAAGEGAGSRVGETVCALLPGGGYADYAVAPADHCLPVPEGLSLREAAGLPETYFTVWTNVIERGRLEAGETLLVHGGSSGIGTTAIQIAAARGARVLATAGSAEKCAKCVELGAERAINYREEDFVAVMTEAGGADVVLDMVGGDYIPRNVKCLRPDGRLVMIAFLGGPKAEMNFAPVMVNRLTITGSTLRPQSVQAKARIAAALGAEVWPLIAEGRIGPVMDKSYPLKDAAQAHARMETSDHIGKIMLEVAGG